MKNLGKKIGSMVLAATVMASSVMASDMDNTNLTQPQAKVMAFSGIPSKTVNESELKDTNGEWLWLVPYAIWGAAIYYDYYLLKKGAREESARFDF